MYLQSEEQLREIYGFAQGRAVDKELNALEKHSIKFIEHSPFVCIATYGNSGMADSSPRGGKPGFVKVLNANCILVPDGNGNNRIDSMVNIVETGYIGCLFLLPGVDETLRVNGTARISTNPEHLALFASERNPPKTCIEIQIKEVFLHCAKAFMRSKLWSPETAIKRSDFPSMGKMLNDQLSVNEEPEPQEAMVERYKTDL